jgi:acyl-CoA dehydrogenase
MNEQQTMLADMAGSLFAELGHGAAVAVDWSRIEEMGFAGLLLGEDAGGFGGSWVDANIVFRLAGYHALALPLVEAVIAARIATNAGFDANRIGTLAERSEGSIDNGNFTGTVHGVAWGRDAAYVVAPAPSGGAMILSTQGAQIEERNNVAGEPRDLLTFASAAVTLADADIFALGAAARSMQTAGALDAVLALAVGYVNDRKQFGKSLAKFQAVQQSLAIFACEAAAANSAGVGVAQALDRGDADFEIAAAKARANMAAGVGTSIGHQAHAAIGFTHEYGLHPMTRRLWSWRSEFGSEHYWSMRLGTRIAQAGADNFWADMVRRSDPVG